MELISIGFPLSDSKLASKDEQLSIAIGHFDGVHKGHQNVIKRAVDAARQQGLKSAVMTFHPHPKAVLGQGEQYFSCLTPLESKLAQFEALGVDYVFVMKFDHSFASISPERFVSEVLVPLGVRHTVVGFDFRYGSRGAGDAQMLGTLGSEQGLTTEVVEPLLLQGQKISSTYVREALDQGNMALVEDLLGRSYEVEGVVVHGHARGRLIGFPTANVGLTQPYITPRLGVYAAQVVIGGQVYPAVLNHGMKPTFKDGEKAPVLEAHLIGFSGDLYDQSIRIRFISFIRPEHKFASVDELIAQIGRDRDEAAAQLEELQSKEASPVSRNL
ncbi:riboflavin kinase/FMN adenylyltransferase [Paenibacillus cellulosilyticus]|uniref:Riboflavin biosynthesis protein n=1 Tax=Paenibacillus cellulosilyticus TaxID=375489 RepID=A0A2V2YXU7_9BACL|nr:bifunctional riboflavin kinase/FAD synthetase [Paenibacillus cellulosilyticus]PWW06444.1 riboflavin kinase/FMN adenylyltransferase [Paenibacillus cellulosilyticus]QKS46211.1 bifunctional riboflavin kinase/FAD synthetase [Paenibacillus cellulosilyticus]